MDAADDVERLLHGECHLLAVALHRMTGLPLGAYLDEDEEVEGPVLAHAFVIHDDHAIDARGRIPIGDVLDDEFDTMDTWLVDLSEVELLQLGEGEGSIAIDDPRYANAERHAARLVEELGLSSGYGIQV